MAVPTSFTTLARLPLAADVWVIPYRRNVAGVSVPSRIYNLLAVGRPVIVTADPAECSFQLKATGTEKYTTGCDVIKAALVGLSVNYENVAAPAGTPARMR